MVALEKDVRAPMPPARRASWAAAAVVVVLVALGISSGGGGSGPVRAAGVEVSVAVVQPWPFTVASGLLACEGGAVTFTAGGVEYGVNGTAQDLGYPGPDAIWADDPETPGLKVSISAVIDRGLQEC